MAKIGIYHSADNDGLACAAIFKLKYPDGVLIPWDYWMNDDAESIMELVKGINPEDDVWMMDVSLKPDQMIATNNRCNSFIWIDHHKTAIEKINFIHFTQSVIDPRGETAACELAWNHFFPDETIPKLITMLGDYDVHRTYKAAKEVQYIKSINYWNNAILPLQNRVESEMSVDYILDRLSNSYSINELIKEGSYMLKHENYLCARAAQSSFLQQNIGSLTMFNLPFAVINTSGSPSRIAEKVYEQWDSEDSIEEDISFVVIYRQVKKNVWKYSLRSRGEVDVSAIASEFGGGGHTAAAGFTHNKNIFA